MQLEMHIPALRAEIDARRKRINAEGRVMWNQVFIFGFRKEA